MAIGKVLTALVAASAAVLVESKGFFVCPAPCLAMFLPRDMEDIDDCICFSPDKASSTLLDHGESTKVYRCPDNSSASILHPRSFADCVCTNDLHRDEKAGQCVAQLSCEGKYELKSGLLTPRSLADCKCVEPYTKDESTGECMLTYCPRAANYVKHGKADKVKSLADCDCLAPYTKNPQSGECFIRFECPNHSSPPLQGYAKSIGDCTCDWGFIHPTTKSLSNTTDSFCVAEKPSFACPLHSRPLTTLDGSPVNFLDCECADGFERDDQHELCANVTTSFLRGTSTPVLTQFECPDFSVPLAPHPHSMAQCQCLPGFEPNWGLHACDWTPHYYVCPLHSFNPFPALPALDFMDCHCAKGYQRNDAKGVCEVRTHLNENGCPIGSLIENWPVHDPSWDCFCPFGESDDNSDIEAIASQEFLKKLGQANLDEDFGITCLPPPTGWSFGCPHNAVMNTWPILKIQDCSCKAGYEGVATDDHFGMACNETSTTRFLPACANGMTRSPSDNVCRYPAEDVAVSSSHPIGKIVVDGNELDFVLVEEDIMVTQGDIAVGTSFGYLSDDDDNLFFILHGYYNKEKESRWKDAKMCFTIDPSVLNRRQDIWDAMNHISLNTGFSFLECKEEYCDDHLDDCDDLVDFSLTASSCWSSVGRVGGRQMLGVSDDCGKGNLIHVILHAIGLHHPTLRRDRDGHVQIAWECVDSTKRSFFAAEHLETIESDKESSISSVPYDFFSIMHYRADAFVNTSMEGGCMTVFPLIQDPYERQSVLTGMGQRDQMSLTDIHYVWALYPALRAKQQDIHAAASLDHAFDISDVESTLEVPEHHESRLHTKADTINYHQTNSTSNTVGAIVCVVAFVAVVGFAMIELKRLAKKKAEADDRYADPLLSDTMYE
ncbi:unnamed protein product [Aphanomyces euteiches]|nr:hypothetical protein Ae201684P_019769 [Aphanomyces euteiches]KAH9143157.1 hypothetical protein AeRB84_012819 [Aphanomyces euteiches]